MPTTVPGQRKLRPWPDEEIRTASSSVAFGFIMMPLERSYTQSELTRKARVQMPACMPVMAERDNNGYLQMSTGTPEATIFYSLDGNGYREYTAPFEFIDGGKVQTYAVSEKLGKSLVTTVELPIFVDHSAWKIVFSSSDSQGRGAKRHRRRPFHTLAHPLARTRSGVPSQHCGRHGFPAGSGQVHLHGATFQ